MLSSMSEHLSKIPSTELIMFSNIAVYIYLINRVRGLYGENIGLPGLGSTDRAASSNIGNYFSNNYERSSKQTV